MRAGLAPISFHDKTWHAIRSLTRWTNSACARMKLPMNRKIQRVGHGRKRVSDGDHAEYHRQRGTEQRRDRERDSLGDPQHDHERHDRTETVCRR